MSPPPGSLRSRTLRAVVVGVVLQLIFVAAFLVPGHDPKPSDLPIATVGPPPPGLEDRGFDVMAVDDERAARAAVEDRSVYGALLPGRTLVASGGSLPVAQIVGDLGRGPTVDVAPLAEGDARGTSLNLLVLPIIITSILGALLAMQFAPDLSTRGRVPVAAGIGALAGSGVVGIVKALDALSGPVLPEIGVVALATTALALIAAGMIRLIGPPGVLASFLLFLVVGNPASGLAGARELLPTPWRELGGLLPPGALGDALRGVGYFDGAAVGGPVLVLLAWLGIGIGIHVLADRRRSTAAAA